MAKIGLFSERNARAISAHVRKFGRKQPALNRNGRGGPITGRRLEAIEAPPGGIPAMDENDVMGSAECEIMRRNPETDKLEGSGEFIMVYSMIRQVTLDNGKRRGQAAFNGGGDWLVSVGDCSDV